MRLQTRVANGVAVEPIPHEPAFCTGKYNADFVLRRRGADSIEARRANNHACMRPDICTQPDSPNSSLLLQSRAGPYMQKVAVSLVRRGISDD